jgi:cobyrinic acid a,c-diamide synthase
VADTDVAIVEGVMGLYDGRDGRSDVGSTAEMAKLLSAPVLLVLDCWTLARSAAAIIRGYTTFDPALEFAGVVFNKVRLIPLCL